MANRKKVFYRFLVLLLAIPVLVVAFFVFIVGPVDSSRENSIQYAGVVASVAEGTSHDIVFRLKDHPHTYYINRGLESGLQLETLQKELTGQKIDLWYANSWPLKGGHITHLEHDGRIWFDEWQLADNSTSTESK